MKSRLPDSPSFQEPPLNSQAQTKDLERLAQADADTAHSRYFAYRIR